MVPGEGPVPGTGTELGNQVSSLFVDLPVDEPDPEERFHVGGAARPATRPPAAGR